MRSPVVFDDIHFDRRDYDPQAAYAQSKTANSLFAVEDKRTTWPKPKRQEPSQQNQGRRPTGRGYHEGQLGSAAISCRAGATLGV
jgi:hypothetical protein